MTETSAASPKTWPKTWIVAEIGINHEGSVETCARMVEEAARAGADAIKLQTVDADENYLPGTESHVLFSRAALSREETARIFALSRDLGIAPFTTVGDVPTLEWIRRLDPWGYKVSSGLLTHLPLIQRLAALDAPLVLSTGMAEPADIDAAMAAAGTGGNARVTLLHCTSLYPAPIETLNLATIGWLAERYDVPVGFSDHSLGIEAAPLAVAVGACMIEKHFSLDSSRPTFDHWLSLEPKAFAEMVARVRAAEAMLGVRPKTLSPQERTNRDRYHRAIVARRDVATGARLEEADIGFMRLQPGMRGLAPAQIDRVLGRRAARSLSRYDVIAEDMLD